MPVHALPGDWHSAANLLLSLLLLLTLFQSLIRINQDGHGGLWPGLPESVLVVQKAGGDLDGVVAPHWEGEEELGLEVVLLYQLRSLQSRELRGLKG